ncbi:phytanoyl-CoA dioxygenase family protein [Aspergillus foveolatus]|uniref:phytanoyl-CoA dioxygenase family protein n=1 Tax=Aspergillus foveolatus TaxID=210207 RepID=UPI003CCCC0EF
MGSALPLPSLQRLPSSAGLESVLQVFHEDGAVIITDFLSPSQVNRLNAEFSPSLDTITPKTGTDLAAFLGGKTKRLPAVPNSKTFRDEVLENELMHALSERILVDGPPDGYHINCAQVIALGPGANAQPFHRDQGLWSFWEKFPAFGPEACVNFLCALTPFREVNGATRVIPRSHLSMADLSTFNEQSETVAVEMEPGEALFFSGRLIHRGGANRTDKVRRALTIHLCRNGLNTQEAHPLTIPRAIAETMSYRAQAMFGFRSGWPLHQTSGVHFWSKAWEEVGQGLGLKQKQMNEPTSTG